MKIAIQGHPTRGHEVIQILESWGGINQMNYEGGNSEKYYYIARDSIITVATAVSSTYTKYTLKELEKEFPFKIGDRVISETTNFIGTITKLRENSYYHVKYDNGILAYVPAKNLELYKKMKEKRNITLTLDKAKEWYKKGGELKEVALQAFSEKELNLLPRSWEEFCNNYPRKKGESYVSNGCSIITLSGDDGDRDFDMDRNICPSEKSAEAHLAMIQLEQLRDCWRQGWEPIWDCSEKWCIHLRGNELGVGLTTHASRFLAFPTNKMAREFLECFKDLIKKAKDLI